MSRSHSILALKRVLGQRRIVYFALQLLDPLNQDASLSRQLHDWYNIIVLPWVCALNCLNWSFGYTELMRVLCREARGSTLWRGDYFWPFFWSTFAYFVIDALWVLTVPNCVRSPKVILQHHVSALLYMCIPYHFPEYAWAMGAVMSVEVNTWLIIARRMFNQTFRVTITCTVLASGSEITIKPISIFFYVTWILIRVIVYPAFFVIMLEAHFERWGHVGSAFNVVGMALVFQFVLVALNFKWSYDLFMSKLRHTGPSKGL